MRLEVQARQLSGNSGGTLEPYIKRRLDFALGGRYEQINRIRVTLDDINGPRGGTDKRCQIVLKISGQTDVVIEDIQTNLRLAIDRAASRAKRTVERRQGRIRHKLMRLSETRNPSEDFGLWHDLQLVTGEN